MHEDELLAEYRRRYPQYRHMQHRDWMMAFERSLERAGWVGGQLSHGGYATITQTQRTVKGEYNAKIGNVLPPFGVGEILVLEAEDGREVQASGRARNPAKWIPSVSYAWREDYSQALGIAIAIYDIFRGALASDVAARYGVTLDFPGLPE